MGTIYTPLQAPYNYRNDPFLETITPQAIIEKRKKIPASASYWVQLRECPPVTGSVGDVDITDSDTAVALTEVAGTPAAGEYRVDYANRTGLVEFNAAQAGVEVDVSYKGTGSPILANLWNMPGLIGLTGGFGGTGALGDVTISADTSLNGTPYNYNNLTINNTKIVTPDFAGGHKQLIILVRETLILNGVIDASGLVGRNGIWGNPGNEGGAGGAGAIYGGDGGDTYGNGSPGAINNYWSAQAGAGGAGSDGGKAGSVPTTYGLYAPIKLAGNSSALAAYAVWPPGCFFIHGASGSGGGGGEYGGGGGGGGAAGFIYIECRTLIFGATGCLYAKGGNGGNGAMDVPAYGGGGGGGGSGGWIFVRAERIETNTGTVIVTGGTGGTGVAAGANGADGDYRIVELGALTG